MKKIIRGNPIRMKNVSNVFRECRRSGINADKCRLLERRLKK